MPEDQEDKIRKLRSWATIALIVCYTLPLILLTLYNTSLLPLDQGWSVLTTGLLAALIGSIILFLILRRWEGSIRLQRWAFAEDAPQPEHIPPEWPPTPAIGPDIDISAPLSADEINRLNELLAASQKQCESLGEELHTVQHSLEALKREKEELEHLQNQSEQALSNQKILYEDQLKNKETLLEEYQQTITDQRAVIEKKQQVLTSLESEAQDLKYELKTLVDLSDRLEEAPTPPVKAPDISPKTVKIKSEKADTAGSVLDLGLAVSSRSTEEAHQQLKRCIDIAQKLTGARHLAGDSSRFRDLSADGFALDLRRLCDSLRSEQSSMILLFSQRDNKALFVNDQVRGLLGWSPDKFLQSFPGVAEESLKDWRAVVQKAATGQRSETLLKMKTRAGEEHTVRCLLGNIPTGIFKNHIIGVLYPAE